MNILFVGHYGGRNLGDEIILLAQIQQFNKEFEGDNTFYVFSYDEKFSLDLYKKYNINIKTIKGFNLRNFYSSYLDQKQKINEVDLIVIGGGGLIQDVYFSYGIFRYVLPCLIGYKLNKKIITYSLGVYRFNNKINKRIFSSLLEFISVISVRDIVSKNECEKLTQKKIYQIPDSALMFDIKALPDSRNNIKYENKYYVTIMLRDFFEMYLEDFVLKVKELLKDVDSNTKVIDIIVFENNNFERKIAETLKSLLRNEEIEIFIKDNFDPINYLQDLNSSELVISGRLHGMIPSVLLEKKFIPLSYSPKMSSFCIENNYKFIDIEKLKDNNFFFKDFINTPNLKPNTSILNSDLGAFNRKVKEVFEKNQSIKKKKSYNWIYFAGGYLLIKHVFNTLFKIKYKKE